MAWDHDIPIEEQLLTERILMLTHSIQLLRCGVRPIHKEGIRVLQKHIEELKKTPQKPITKKKKFRQDQEREDSE
jgi:hypothetical protein